ncbi:MAG: iron-containing redox enzyme family protein [Acidobacteria bacterium]|nr:iron-containing redox enzyme family protein [Acidobacteriota bacterium]
MREFLHMPNTAESHSTAGGVAAINAPSTPTAVTGIAPEEIKRYMQLYAANPLFGYHDKWIISDNPYRRPIDQQAVTRHDFSRPLKREEAFGSSALAAQRMLFNVYETDFVFLPEKDFAAKRADFESFYSNENKLLGELIRPTLETHLFGFLEEEIDISGKWSAAAVESYLRHLIENHERSEIDILSAVLSSLDPEKAALTLLIQVAGDFLTESSSSARNLLGKFGLVQSELFKIAIDDYGYGVHKAKHSTLFESTLETCGLATEAHAYWHFYLTGSLALNNYYHYVCRDHSKFFRAIGAIAVGESLFAHTCRKFSEMLRAVFGNRVDTYYFDEHYHIDAHHGRMATENVVAPAIAKYGDSVIPEIVRGMEELQSITSLADDDFMAQLIWADDLEGQRTAASRIHQSGLSQDAESRITTAVLRKGDPISTRACDADSLWLVESGTLELVAGHDRSIQIEAGEGIVVLRGRLHGASSVSPECLYHVYELKD